jgi:molybdate transport system substrate-binding protein
MVFETMRGSGGPDGVRPKILRVDADIGLQQMAELMTVLGIDIVELLPAELQCLTAFAAAIPATARHRGAAKFSGCHKPSAAAPGAAGAGT